MPARKTAVSVCLGLALLMASAVTHAQYHLTNLVSNQLEKHAASTDPLLVNPWGLARSAGSPWWLSDNLSGWSTLYNAAGTPSSLRVLIPTFGNGPVEPAGNNGVGTPTGIVWNGSKDFQSSPFIFDTLDGTISAWLPGVNKNLTTIEQPSSTATPVPTAANSPSYTGLAVTSNAAGNFLFAADNANNEVDVFDGNFNFVKSFGDASIPSAFSVFGVQDINGSVYVTYAATNGGPGGYVDVFTEAGVFVKTLIHGAPLNQPWGVALAPANFGPLSNTLLISNNSNHGTINGFDPAAGGFVATIRDEFGREIALVNLWGIAFGGGNATNNGATNELFVTAGPGFGAQAQLAGTFASIVYNPPPFYYDEGHSK